jgi:hypothetical protein
VTIIRGDNRVPGLNQRYLYSTITSSENSGFCSRCGAPLQANALYCSRCGTAFSPPTPSQGSVSTSPAPRPQQLDWREQRREWRAQRRAERHGGPGAGIGALVVATILIVVGLGIFFPQLPWQLFWGSLVIVLGLWIVYLWFRRSHTYSPQQPQ